MSGKKEVKKGQEGVQRGGEKGDKASAGGDHPLRRTAEVRDRWAKRE